MEMNRNNAIITQLLYLNKRLDAVTKTNERFKNSLVRSKRKGF